MRLRSFHPGVTVEINVPTTVGVTELETLPNAVRERVGTAIFKTSESDLRELRRALDAIPENTPAKEARLAAMVAAEATAPVPAQVRQLRWIGRKSR